jgi:hypothetical protein
MNVPFSNGSDGVGHCGRHRVNTDRKERMIMDASKLAAAVLVATALGVGANALAQTTTATPPTTATLAIPELIDRLSTQGYSNVSEVERKSDKLYKVKARDAEGRDLEMYVDARTAEILASEED